jgi:ABC-type lipoprotein export system ATPase subunit
LIALEHVEKVYRTGKLEYPAFRGVDLTIRAGEMVAVVGPSGSGKTTIMNIITGIDRPTSGTVTVDGRAIHALSEEQLAVWRGRNVGIVFQFFQLLPTLTALENAMLPPDFARKGGRGERRTIAEHKLDLVGLGDMLLRCIGARALGVVGIEFGFTFPLVNLLIALAGTLVLALVLMRLPLRRAVRLEPGEAIRYA